MSVQILRDSKLFLDGYDFSGDMSALALAYGAELQDNTTFGMDTRSRLGGLKTVTVQHEGFWNGGANGVDDVLFGKIGVASVPMTIAPMTGAEGELAYSFLSNLGQYTPGATVGEMLRFSVSGEASGELVRGSILLNATKTLTGNGTAFNVGAASSTQKLYAALHVIAASGTSPTLDVKVQSDDASGFGTPTDRITFSQATAIGSQWATPVNGAITDNWWRINYTIGGTGPSFTFVVFIGIQ